MKVYFHQEKIKTIHLVNTRVIDSDGQLSFYGVFIFSIFSRPSKVIIIVIEFKFLGTNIFWTSELILTLALVPARSKIQSTPGNSNLPLTRSNFHFPSGRFLYNWTLDNSNFFLFPLIVRIIGS